MNTSPPRPYLLVASASLLALACLAGCGVNADDRSSSATTVTPPATETANEQPNLAPQGNVQTAFKPVLGSQGNGLGMTELKTHGGQLREPDAKYDVYDTTILTDLKTITQNIQASLDRDHTVMIDSDGTPSSREKAARITYEAIGASLPDMNTLLVKKAPEEHGGGYLLIPIYTKADVAEQIAQGKITHPSELNNSIENFFFEPKQTKP